MGACWCTLPHYYPGCCERCPNNRVYDGTDAVKHFDAPPVIDYERLADEIAKRLRAVPPDPVITVTYSPPAPYSTGCPL